MINAELDEIEYPPEATIGDQCLRIPWKRSERVSCAPRSSTPADLHSRIAEAAYKLFVREGCCQGQALDHWLQSEKMILSQLIDQEKRTGEYSDGKENE